jgi:hypothetical protein
MDRNRLEQVTIENPTTLLHSVFEETVETFAIECWRGEYIEG